MKTSNNINEYKLIRALKWIFYYIFYKFFRLENIIYKRFFSKKDKINRLFVTTGNISLINALCIIKELGNTNVKNNIIVIDTGKGGNYFAKKQLDVLSSFKHIKVIIEPHINPGVQIVLKNCFNVDEIFILNHPMHLNKVLNLFPNIPFNLIDEGCASLINYNDINTNNFKYFYTQKYLNKIDGYGFSSNILNKIKIIDINIFKELSYDLSSKYPINITLQKQDKYLLYCGLYWEGSGLEKNIFIEEQNLMIRELISAKYKILFKPHPRDNEYYGLDNNPNIILINAMYPIELYNLDVLAIVVMASTAGINIGHYWDLPSFCNIEKEALKKDYGHKSNLIKYIVKEYTPSYKELLNLDVENISRDKLKIQVKHIYENFIKNKPLLSQNENIKEFIRGMNEIKK